MATRRETLPYTYEDPETKNRKQRRGVTYATPQDIPPTSPLRRDMSSTSTPQVNSGLRRKEQAPTQAALMLEYENLGNELRNPERTTESVQAATARRAEIMGQIERDPQGRVRIPANVTQTKFGNDYSGVNRWKTPVVNPSIGRTSIQAPQLTQPVASAAEQPVAPAAEQPVELRERQPSAASDWRQAINYMGDRAANFLTGGRVDQNQNAATGVRGGSAPGRLTPEQEAANRAYGETLSPGLAAAAGGQGTYVGPGPRTGTAPAIEAANNSPLRENRNATIYKNPDGSFTNRPGPGSEVYQTGDSVLSSNGIGTPELRAYADVIRNRWANNMAGGGRRMGGGAAPGGNILRQVQNLNRRADRMQQELVEGGMNTKGATRMSQGLRDQADQLLDYQRNRDFADVSRERIAEDAAYREQALGVQAAKNAADMEAAAREVNNEWVRDLATINGPDGEAIQDYDGLAFAADYLGIDPRNRAQMTANSTALRGLLNFRRDLIKKVRYLPDRAEMDRIMSEARSTTNLDLSDWWSKEGDINPLDVFLSNIGFGPAALRLDPETVITYDPSDFTRGGRDRFRSRNTD